MREKLTNEIQMMQQQANHYLELHQQAVGAVNALQWALAQLPEEVMSEKQLLDAIARGVEIHPIGDTGTAAPEEA
jgi:hypothetical protein